MFKKKTQDVNDKLMCLVTARKRCELAAVQISNMITAIETSIDALTPHDYNTTRLKRICYALRKTQTGIEKEIEQLSS